MRKLICFIVTIFMLTAAAPCALAADEMLLHYDFENAAEDVSGSGADGIIHGGVNVEDGYAVFDGADGYIEMPEGLLENQSELTIAVNVCPKNGGVIFDFGGTDGNISACTSETELRAAVSSDDKEGAVSVQNGIPQDKFASVIVVIKDKTMKLYRDAQLVAENNKLPVSGLVKTVQNWLGKSSEGYFSGAIADFRIYSRALSGEKIRFVDDELNKDRYNYKLRLDADSIAFEKAYRVTENLVLPTVGAQSGAEIVWKSSDENVITSDGAVTRPSDADKTVTMTAAVGGRYERNFEFTVLRVPTGAEIAKAVLNRIDLPRETDSLDMKKLLPEGVGYSYEGLSENAGVLTAPQAGKYMITLTKDGITRECAVIFGGEAPEAEDGALKLKAQLEDYETYLKGIINLNGIDGRGTAIVNFYDNGGVLTDSCTARITDGEIPVTTDSVGCKKIRIIIGKKIYTAE